MHELRLPTMARAAPSRAAPGWHMSIIRVRHRRGYTSIADQTLRNPRLRLATLGLLVRLLSRPDGWEVRPGPLARECGIGRDQLRRLLRELESTGYLARRRSRDAQGQWSWGSEVYDQSTIAVFSGDGKPGDGPPVVGESGDPDSTDTSITDTSITDHPRGGELAWPAQLAPAARDACAREVGRCTPEQRDAIVRELSHRLARAHDPLRLPHLWVRALARAARAGTLARLAPAAPLSVEQRAAVEQDYQRRVEESRRAGETFRRARGGAA